MGATSMNLQRRRFLEGAGGALLTLPLLEANATETVVPPKRLVAAGTFYGLMPQLFHPKKVGRPALVVANKVAAKRFGRTPSRQRMIKPTRRECSDDTMLEYQTRQLR